MLTGPQIKRPAGQRQEAVEPGLPAKAVTGQNKIYGMKTIMHVNNCYPHLKQWFVFSVVMTGDSWGQNTSKQRV